MMAQTNTFTSSVAVITKDAVELYANFDAYWNEQNITQEERVMRTLNFQNAVHNLAKKFKEEEYQLLVEHRIGEARRVLSEWWDKCFTSDAERMQFLPFYSNDFSEELLAIHIQEKLNVMKYYNENLTIINLVKKQNEMFEVVKSIATRSLNADRLFKNRGAQLLKEEQDRRIATKELPKLEAKTLKEMTKFKNLHGTPFLIFGETFDVILEHQGQVYKENKLQIKVARENTRKMLQTKPLSNKSSNLLLKQETSLAAPCSSTSKLHTATYIATTSTGSKMTLKRKVPDSDTPSDARYLKMPKVTASNATSLAVEVSRARRRLVEPRKLIKRPTTRVLCTPTSNNPRTH